MKKFFYFNTNTHISGVENTCDCTCNDCVLEHCFSETIFNGIVAKRDEYF